MTPHATKPRARVEVAWLISDAIGVTDEPPLIPVDILAADEPAITGRSMAETYRELLSIAIERISLLQKTVDRQRETIAHLREALRDARKDIAA